MAKTKSQVGQMSSDKDWIAVDGSDRRSGGCRALQKRREVLLCVSSASKALDSTGKTEKRCRRPI